MANDIFDTQRVSGNAVYASQVYVAGSATASMAVTTDASTFASSASVKPVATAALVTASSVFAGSTGSGATASMAITTASSIFSGSASASSGPVATAAMTTDAAVMFASAWVSPVARMAVYTDGAVFSGSSGLPSSPGEFVISARKFATISVSISGVASVANFIVGDESRLSAIIYDIVGVPVDPSALNLAIRTPSGVISNNSPVRDAVGNYHFDLMLNESGSYFYRWESTGTYPSADESGVFVYPKSF